MYSMIHLMLLYMYIRVLIHVCFEVWVKLTQQWLVCAPLGIHLEPINKELMLLVTIINWTIWPNQRTMECPNKKQFGPMVCHMSLSKTLMYMTTCIHTVCTCVCTLCIIIRTCTCI